MLRRSVACSRHNELGALPLPVGERVGVRGRVTLNTPLPPHPARKSAPTSPHRGEVEQVAYPRVWRQAVTECHTPFAISRSLNFWIFPVEVFGISTNTT